MFPNLPSTRDSFPSRFLSAASLLAVSTGLLSLPSAASADNTFKTLHTFAPATEGNTPYPSLVQGADGRFYGTNSSDGKNANGTVYSIKMDGSGFSVLSSFPDTNGGTEARGGVVQASDGNFYGTTYAGGSNGVGTLYQVTPDGTLTYLASFNNGTTPGANPTGTLTEGYDGLLYGTAQYGGNSNFGTVYRVTPPAGSPVAIASITGGLAGAYPQSDLCAALDGNFYGTDGSGGTYANGTFFRITPAGVYTTLYSFTGSSDGRFPLRGVVQGPDGAFYGATQQGGAYSGGAIFRLVVSGDTAAITVLYDFNSLLGDGITPDSNLTVASDGNLYGTTSAGGTYSAGTIYRVTISGGFQTIYSFGNGSDGGFPVGGLTQGNDGKLYGTTAGQSGSSGTIFKVDLGLPIPPPAPVKALVASAKAGDTILIKGDHFVGATAVSFTGTGGTPVAATSFTVDSKTLITAVVPTGAATGAITIAANGLTGISQVALTIINNTPLSTVAIKTKVPTATEGGAKGKIKVTRNGGDLTAALTVNFKVAASGTATRGVDYNLYNGTTVIPVGTNSITIPAGAIGVTLKLVASADGVAEPTETVAIKLKAGTGYTVDTILHKSKLTIIDND